MSETESQKAIREAIAAGEARRNTPSKVQVSRIPEAPGDDCPECQGNAGTAPCNTCGI